MSKHTLEDLKQRLREVEDLQYYNGDPRDHPRPKKDNFDILCDYKYLLRDLIEEAGSE